MTELEMSLPVTTLAIFCGSRPHLKFNAQAYRFGWECGRRGVRVIYGNGGKGLMGSVARGACDAGGAVRGITPAGLFADQRAETPPGVETFVTCAGAEGMQQRKGNMYAPAHAFVAFPGGPGTMDEFWEAVTWSDLSLHDGRPVKPAILMNWKLDSGEGFYDHIARHLDLIAREGLGDSDLAHIVDTTDEAFEVLGIPEPAGPAVPWIEAAS